MDGIRYIGYFATCPLCKKTKLGFEQQVLKYATVGSTKRLVTHPPTPPEENVNFDVAWQRAVLGSKQSKHPCFWYGHMTVTVWYKKTSGSSRKVLEVKCRRMSVEVFSLTPSVKVTMRSFEEGFYTKYLEPSCYGWNPTAWSGNKRITKAIPKWIITYVLLSVWCLPKRHGQMIQFIWQANMVQLGSIELEKHVNFQFL